MPIVPLGVGAYKRTGLPEAILRNLYLEKDKSGLSPDGTARLQRPGLIKLSDYGQALRGLHNRTALAQQIAIAGSSFLVNGTSAGSVAGIGMAALTSTAFATFAASGGVLYRYTDTLGTVALPNDAPFAGFVQDVDQLNGYGLALLPNGRFYWIEPGEITIDPLNFATAESLPDAGVALRRLGDEFWIFGAENVEVWQATGDVDAPFQRAPGRNFERGCLYRDTVRRFDNTLVWVGDDKQVYRASSVPQVISDNGISERIGRASGPCSAWTFGITGHSFYVLTIPGEGTFAYDASTQAWSEFATYDEVGWRPWVGYEAGGKIYAGSSVDGAIYEVTATAALDDGQPIERIVSGTVGITGKTERNDSASFACGVSADSIVRLRWRDGQDDYPDYYDEIQVQAPFDVANLWRLGSPDQPYRTFELSCVDPVILSIAGMKANEGWS